MREQNILYIGIGLLAGIIFGFFVGYNLQNYSKTPVVSIKTMSQPVQTDQMDQHFIEQMIPHHEDAITMSKLALTKAKKAEIKTLAVNIIRAQQLEIDDMKLWYKNWYGRDLPTGEEVMNHHGMMSGSDTHMGMMGNNSDEVRLESAADFDKAFIEHMIPHHQMAVMMVSMLKDGSNKPEMKKLADDIVTSQTNEINQMRKWYEEWQEKK